MTAIDIVLLIAGLLLGVWEIHALRNKTEGDTISERLRFFVRAHPFLAGLFIAFSVWFPLHIFDIVGP